MKKHKIINRLSRPFTPGINQGFFRHMSTVRPIFSNTIPPKKKGKSKRVKTPITIEDLKKVGITIHKGIGESPKNPRKNKITDENYKKYAVTIRRIPWRKNPKKEKEFAGKILDLLKEYKDIPMFFCNNVEINFTAENGLYFPEKNTHFIITQIEFQKILTKKCKITKNKRQK